jgi:hypothetical protein
MMKAAISQNFLTTLFGILAGLPVLVTQSLAGSGLELPPVWNHWLLVLSGIGLIGLGIVSKAFNVHSTSAEVAKATVDEQTKVGG